MLSKKYVFSIIFTLSICINPSNAQNFKKVFKYLEKNKTEKAIVELQKTNPENQYTNLELIYAQLATVLIKNSKSTSNYNCYEALSAYKNIDDLSKNVVEIDKFLKKYNLDVELIKNKIYLNILEDVKQTNTEKAFFKAFKLCDSCFYLHEVISLMENAAYNEAKTSNNIKGYSYFVNTYSYSEHYNEIYFILTKLEFNKVKNKNSVQKLNEFLTKYQNDNSFKTQALSIKDSLVFFNTPKDYTNYKSFISSNKNSKYLKQAKSLLPDLLYNKAKRNDKINLFEEFAENFPKDTRTSQIKSEIIPDLIFTQGIANNDISLLERFILEYPEDTIRVDSSKEKIENMYSEKILKNYMPNEFNKFKKRFPNSSYTVVLEKKYQDFYKNSDWKKVGLNGRVKRIGTRAYNYKIDSKYISPSKKKDKTEIFQESSYSIDKSRVIFQIVKDFHENGKYQAIGIDKNSSYSAKSFMGDYFPYYSNNETKIMSDLGMYKHASEYINHEFHIDRYYNNLNFIYNSENRLIEVSNSSKKHFIKYDLKGNIILIEGVFQDSDYDHKVEYMWNGNDLIQKKIYKNASLKDIFIQYDISRANNNLTIERRNEYNVLEFKATLMVDNKGLVKEKLLEYFKNSYEEKTGFSRIYYKYDINDNLVDITSDYYSKAKSKTSAFIEANYGNPITQENGELYIGPKKVLTKIIRDEHGNIVKTKKTIVNKKNYVKDKDYRYRYGYSGVWSKRWEYDYDNLGNWIKRIEYEVLDDDSRIKHFNVIIYRSIEYYE